tara:strand:+ start:435 stop:1754 length:1320 start_codon:yes stop_codon:yes gene_type:complete
MLNKIEYNRRLSYYDKEFLYIEGAFNNKTKKFKSFFPKKKTESLFLNRNKKNISNNVTDDLIIKGRNIFSPNNRRSIGTSTTDISLLDIFLPPFKQIESKKVNLDIKKKLPIELTEEEEKFEFEIINEKINNISDLINLGKKYKEQYKDKKKKYNLNLRVLSDLVKPLEDLNKLIGLKNIKNKIFEKIILYLQGLNNSSNDFKNVVIYGGPGMGKTEVAKIIGKIYSKMGFLSKGDFKEIKVTDLKGGYVGQSEIKTQKLLDESKGCVLFFDEAYALGGDDKLDSFSQSIIDILNPYLSQNKNDFILIIAGYKDDIDKRFFKGNQGLKSRFNLWLKMEEYKSDELEEIFIKKVIDSGWEIEKKNIPKNFFEKNKKYFKYFGRDIENFLTKCKTAHAKRVLFLDQEEKRKISKNDLKEGLNKFIENNNDNNNNLTNHMFI